MRNRVEKMNRRREKLSQNFFIYTAAELEYQTYLKAAEKGDAGAYFNVAYFCEIGRGVEKNPGNAKKMYQIILEEKKISREIKQAARFRLALGCETGSLYDGQPNVDLAIQHYNKLVNTTKYGAEANRRLNDLLAIVREKTHSSTTSIKKS